MELLKKLKIDTARPLWAINVPGSCAHYFEGLELKDTVAAGDAPGQVILFALDREALNKSLPQIVAASAPNTLLWIAYPKKSGAIASDLVKPESWDAVYKAGHHGVTEVAIDKDWTGFRIKPEAEISAFTRAVPVAERQAEGIDFVNRTVQLPPDALLLIALHEGMEAYFNSQSFTCKKEYALAIIDAKKEDTRRRRIESMIKQLQEKMDAKAAKQAKK